MLFDMRLIIFFFFSSRRRHTRLTCDWSSDVCSSDLEVRLVDATITSTLELRGARLENPRGVALRLDRAEILSSLYCDKGFIANGEVCAIGAHVKGTAYFNDAQVGTG